MGGQGGGGSSSDLVNKFDQVSSLGHQMSLAAGEGGRQGPVRGDPLLCQSPSTYASKYDRTSRKLQRFTLTQKRNPVEIKWNEINDVKAISLSMRPVLSKDVKLLMETGADVNTHTHLYTHAQDELYTRRSAVLVTWNEVGRGFVGWVRC